MVNWPLAVHIPLHYGGAANCKTGVLLFKRSDARLAPPPVQDFEPENRI
jgi:hypothetical protein